MALNNFPGLQEYVASLCRPNGELTEEDLVAIADEYPEIDDLSFGREQ